MVGRPQWSKMWSRPMCSRRGELQLIALTDDRIEKHMPSLDDDSIDFPKAYAAIAMLMRSISLSDEEIASLLDKVDVFGEPRITPKDKLEKELASLDSAASS